MVRKMIRMEMLVPCVFVIILVLANAMTGRAQTLTLDSGLSPTSPASESGFMFDVEALNDIVLESFDVTGAFFSFPRDIEVWTTLDGGSFVGRGNDPLAWKLLRTVDLRPLIGTGTALTFGFWTPLSLSLDLFVPSGARRGFCITGRAGTYLRGHTSSTNGQLFATDANIHLWGGSRNRDFRNFNIGMPAVQAHYHVHGPFAVDLQMSKILSPTSNGAFCQPGGTNELVTVEFTNLGTTPILVGTTIPVEFSLDGQAPSVEFVIIQNPVPPNGIFTYTFLAQPDLSALGQHSLTVSHALGGDQDSNDDSLTLSFDSGGEGRISSFPWTEDFESLNPVHLIVPPAGWTHGLGDPFSGWTQWQFATRRLPGEDNTRPAFDHTTGIPGEGIYAHTNDGSHFPNVALQTPCIDLASVNFPKLSFWLHSDRIFGFPNLLHLDVLDIVAGVTVLDIVAPIGDTGPNWVRQEIDLAAFGGKLIRLTFRGETDHNSTTIAVTNHEFGIDDLALFEFVPSVGQPEQPGFARFNLNSPLNLSFEPLGPGVGGPFFAQANANAMLLFEFSGEPQQPVLLLGGQLNSRAASYPILGSLDLGGAVDVNGIPTGIAVLADGNLATGANPFFTTGFSGDGEFGVILPNLPPGILTTFQCVMGTTGANGAPIAISNAIQLTIE